MKTGAAVPSRGKSWRTYIAIYFSCFVFLFRALYLRASYCPLTVSSARQWTARNLYHRLRAAEGRPSGRSRTVKKKKKEICHGEILSSTGHTKTGKGIVCQISSLLYLAETLMPPFFGLHFPSSCFLDSDSPRKTEKVTCRLSSSRKFKRLRQKFTHEASPVQWPFEH